MSCWALTKSLSFSRPWLPSSGDHRSLRGLPHCPCHGWGAPSHQWVRVLVAQSCPTLCDPMDCNPLGSSGAPWNSPGKNTRVGCHSLLQSNLSDPGIKPGSPTLQADSLPSEPPGKPKHRWCWVISLSHASLFSGPLNLALALLGCTSSGLYDTVTGISSSAAAPPYLGPWGPLGR